MSKKQEGTAIDFEQKICKLDGDPFEIEHAEFYPNGNPIIGSGKPLTLLDVVTSALGQIYEDEKNLTGKEKAARGFLAMQIYGSDGNVLLKVEDFALIKKMIAKRYSSTIIIAQAFSMLDPAETAPE